MRTPEVRLVGGVVVDRGRRTTGSVAFRGDKILGVDAANESVTESPAIDAEGLLISPGLIDLQVNGGNGLDLASEPELLWELADRLPATGVTAFLPTIVSSPPEVNKRAVSAIAARPDNHLGAEPLGLHFEGPMLNPEQSGAHRDNYLRSPGTEVIDNWSLKNGVALVTLAPELQGALEVIEQLVARDIVVSAGHSTATADEAANAVDAGVTMVTHLFNAMTPMHHRSPNLAGLALADRNVVAGVIADGIHVDPVMVATAWAAKGMSRLALVTDAVAAMGMGHGTHMFGEQKVTSDDRGVRREDGTLAGTNLTLDQAFRQLMAFTGCWAEEALHTVTATPAMVLNRSDRGIVAPGTIADLALFDDELNVAITICRGRVVHVAEGHHHRFPEELAGSIPDAS